MSDETTKEMTTTAYLVEAPWWWVATMIHLVLDARTMHGDATVYPEHMTFRKADNETALLTISRANGDLKDATIIETTDHAVWGEIIDRVTQAVQDANALRRRVEPSAEEVIQFYYRSRAAGGKVKLKELAERYGYNATYLSQVKRQYDLLGKWGSKNLDTSKVGT